MNKEEIFEVKVPMQTATYQPVSHSNIYNQTMEQLDKVGLVVTNEEHKANREGTKLVSILDVNAGYDDMNMRIAYRNSYDKSMSVGFVAGTSIIVCSNGMISGELNFMRKHQGAVVKDLTQAIDNTIQQLDSQFIMMRNHSDIMKEIELSNKSIAELVGRMYLEEDLISNTQLNIIKKELETPSYEDFTDTSLWSLYNHCTESFKKAAPMNYIKQHTNLHNFVEQEFKF